MADHIKNYCENSTLYIVRYISDKTKTVLERLVWSVLLVLAVSAIVNYLEGDWAKLRSGPLRVNVDDAGLNVGTVDFPSLTICPANVIHPTKLDQLVTRVLGSSAGKDIVDRFTISLQALALVSSPDWRQGYEFLSSNNISQFPMHSDDIILFFKSVMVPIGDIFMKCFWRGTEFPCSEIFRVQSTELGLCYSFNSFSGIRNYDDSPRNPPFVNNDGNIEVLRTNSEGRSSGVEMFLSDNKNNSKGEIMYYSIVTNPYMYPSTLLMTPLLSQRRSVYHTEVQVNILSADLSLGGMTPQALPCTLDSTVPYNNCLLKCRQHLIWQQCHCVLYTHAILLSLEDFRVCSPQHLKCIADLHKNLNQIQTNFDKFKRKGATKCSCKPTCSEEKYVTRTEVLPRESDLYDDYVVYIEVFYFSKWAMGYVLQSKLNLKDLIANLGGTSGLYLGASFISLMEIFVTFTKILFFYLKRTKH